MEDYREATGLENTVQYHIECGPGDIAPVVIVPGDQGRVEKIIRKMDKPKKVAENRGLITYTGEYRTYPVSVTSTGMGGPSASIVYEELINIGAKVLIRIGSVAGLQESVREGDIVIPYGCIRDDGASSYYVPDNYPAVPSPDVFHALASSAKKQGFPIVTGINWTHSCFYKRDPDYFQNWSRRRVVTMEMESSALFVVSTLRGIKSGFIGVCFANRFKQSQGRKMDLSVENPRRSIIEEGVDRAITITFEAIGSLYNEHLVEPS